MHKGAAICVMALVALSAMSAISACAKSKSEQQAEEAQQAAAQVQKGAEGAAKSAEGMAKGLEQMAKGLEQMAAGGGDGKPVEPVSFRELQAVFPDLSGWEKGKPTGEKMTSPFSYSQAEVTYTNGDARIEAKLMDSAFNQMLLAPFAMFLTSGYEKETEDGYEKSVKVVGNPGWEKWNSEAKDGELNAVVAKRFLLQLEGNNIADTRPLYQIAEKADLGKLASLAK